MKKAIFILVSILFSAFSFLKAQDTLSFQFTGVGYPIDTINKTYVYPEVMNPNMCYDQGPNDPIIGYLHKYVSRFTCGGNPLKAVAQGFMFNDTIALDGIAGLFGLDIGNINPNVVYEANFKIGIMDESYNIIYQKDYLFQPNFQSSFSTFLHIPFDSVLYLNDFVYVFIEWPDSACVGGVLDGELYYDESTKFFMMTFQEEILLSTGHYDTDLPEDMCEACNVKYAPLFKWYGENYWTDLYSLRCGGRLNQLCYWSSKNGGVSQPLDYYPTLGINFYYNNANNQGGDSGLSETDISNLVSLSPNPASDVVTVQSSFKIKEIEIHNSLGQVVVRKEGSQNIETLDVSNLQSGTYIVKIKTQRGFATKKLIIR